MNFAQIIHPVSVEEFFRDYYEKKPLYIARNNPSYYHSLLSLQEIDAYLQLKQTFSPNVKVAYNGKEASPFLFTESTNDVAPYKADPQLLLHLLKQGYTVKYDKLHQTYPPLAQKISLLEEELGLQIRTSLYITPEDTQGYGVHTDRHDVLALQINGTKLWKVKFSEEVLPSHYDVPVKVKWEEGEDQLIELKAGDFFYCPRGLAHDVYTKEQSSVHFTLGFQPVYGYHLAEKLSSLAYENAFFRKAIPNHYSTADEKEKYKKEWLSEFLKIAKNIDVETLIEWAAAEKSKLNFSQGRFLSQFYEPAAKDIFMVNDLDWTLTFTKVACRIKMLRGDHDFPFLMKEFLLELKNKKTVSFIDLPDTLNIIQKGKILKRLLRIGLLSAKI
ncbi:MAG: cupin domain-containing protein [Flavobacteriales bacterium]